MNSLTPSQSRGLLRIFWCGVAALISVALLLDKEMSALNWILALGVGFLALLPGYLWCARKVAGLPIFPILAATYLYAFALPHISNPDVAQYSMELQLWAGLTVCIYLAVATALWFIVVRLPAPDPSSYFEFPLEGSDGIFLSFLALACIYQANSMGFWIRIPWEIDSLGSKIVLTLSTLSATVLPYRIGKNQLNRAKTTIFMLLLFTVICLNCLTLLLVGALTLAFLPVITYTVARGRPPIIVIVATVVVFSILHLGKAEMRAKYLNKGQSIQPTEYVGFFAEWTGDGFEAISQSLQGPGSKKDSASLLQRSSLLQMLLLVEDESPEQVSYLYGQTYAIIPGLLVPRILNRERAWTHEGTYLLNIHYGRQTREATRHTTIGFGLLAESYANFGPLGVLGLAVLTGLGTGYVTHWSLHFPIFSLRSLFALIVLANIIAVESTAAVVVTALFQSTMALLAVAIFLMKTHQAEEATGQLLGSVEAVT